MSAFFLTPNNGGDLIERAEKVFEYRGLRNGRHFKLSCSEILLYPKQMLPDVANYYQTATASVYCIGTLIYCGQSYNDSLQSLMKDICEGCLKYDGLQGSFVVIFDDGKTLSLLTDRTGMYKLFSDKDGNFLTSSFMAAAACIENVKVNRPAVMEQLLCGFISAPDTLIEGINDVSRKSDVQWLNRLTFPSEEMNHQSFSAINGSEIQAKGIGNYMKNASKLLEEYGAECGLSGGCDSRLIYTSVHAKCGKLSSTHTHSTSKIHQSEISIAKQICELHGTPLQIVPTTYLPDCDGDTIDDVLRENIKYFDARNAENIGAMSITHTRKYKEETANKQGLTFSGIGGEIYRDFYYTKTSWYTPKQWLETRIFANGAIKMLRESDYENTVKYLVNKISECIGRDLKGKMKPIDAKDFFSHYRIPNALSNVVHANNQMSFFLSPFTEYSLISLARPDYRIQDHLGRYEGLIIEKFDDKATFIKTSKGNYNLHYIPFKLRLKWALQSRYPYQIWKTRLNMEGKNERLAKAVKSLIEKSTYFRDASVYFKTVFPEISLNPVEEGLVPLNSFVFTVCAIYEIHQLRIKLNLCNE